MSSEISPERVQFPGLLHPEYDRLMALLSEDRESLVARALSEVQLSAADRQVCGDWPRILRGELSLRDGDLTAAEAHFTDGAGEHPTMQLQARCGLATIALRRGNFSAAEAFLTAAMHLEAGNGRACYGFGLLAKARGELDRAWDFFTEALAAEPTLAEAVSAMVPLAFSLKRLPALEGHLRRLLEEDALLLNFRCCLASCLAGQGDQVAAREEVQKVLLFDPQHHDALELQTILNAGER